MVDRRQVTGTKARGSARRILGPALLGALLVAGALFPAAALSQGGQPRMTITSFSQDRTFSAGGFRVGTIAASCRRGFALLGTRFTVTGTSANLSDPRNRPVIGVVGAIPTPKGVTLRLRQFGGGPALVRLTADCAKVTGNVRSRLARASATGQVTAEASAKKKKKKPVGLNTFIVEQAKRVKRTRAAGTQSVRATCDRRNSIPSDLGFESNRSAFGGASFFKRKGRIGVNATFNTDGKDRLKLYLVCQQGQRLNLNGRVAGGGRAARPSAGALSGAPGASAAAKKAKLPGLAVRYGQFTATHFPNVPFPGADMFVDQTPRSVWMNSVPASILDGVLWSGRLLLDRSTGRSSSAAREDPVFPEDPEFPPDKLVEQHSGYVLDAGPLPEHVVAAIERVRRMRLGDKRSPDSLPEFDPDDPASTGPDDPFNTPDDGGTGDGDNGGDDTEGSSFTCAVSGQSSPPPEGGGGPAGGIVAWDCNRRPGDMTVELEDEPANDGKIINAFTIDASGGCDFHDDFRGVDCRDPKQTGQAHLGFNMNGSTPLKGFFRSPPPGEEFFPWHLVIVP